MSGATLPELLAGEPVTEVAPLLLGAVLRHGAVALRLTEVEAYAGADDPGSHAYRSRTPRNEVMFGPAVRLYTYFTYGMHVCANVARSRRPGASDRDLARGPARLCRAVGVGLELGGTDLTSGPVTLTLPPAGGPSGAVSTGPRVGLRGAPDRPWRYWLTGEPTVSAYRPATPRRTPAERESRLPDPRRTPPS